MDFKKHILPLITLIVLILFTLAWLEPFDLFVKSEKSQPESSLECAPGDEDCDRPQSPEDAP